MSRLLQLLPDQLPIGPVLCQSRLQFLDLHIGPLLGRTQTPLDSIETRRTTLRHAAGHPKLRQQGVAYVRRQILQTLGQRTETFDATPRIRTGRQGAVGVTRTNTLTPTRVAHASVRRHLVLAQVVLLRLGGRQGARLQVGPQLRVAHDAAALDGFVCNRKTHCFDTKNNDT